MVFGDPPHMLSPFQKWALLHLHNAEAGISGMNILKACCITAMTDSFQKRDVTDGLGKLERMGLVRRSQQSPKNTSQGDGEMSDLYTITVDGVIYTKKMLRPVLDLLANPEGTERIAQKLADGKAKSWLRSSMKISSSLLQQQILERIVAFGLGNISGLAQILDLLRKGHPIPT